MHLRLEKRINAPADVVWQLLGREFDAIDEWADFVKTSRPISPDEVPAGLTAAPTAPVPGRETMTKVKLVEVITAYDDAARTLTFHGVGLPPVISVASDEQSVRPDGATASTVAFDITMGFRGPFVVLGPLMKRRMTKQFDGILDDLRRHAEATHAAA